MIVAIEFHSLRKYLNCCEWTTRAGSSKIFVQLYSNQSFGKNTKPKGARKKLKPIVDAVRGVKTDKISGG